VAPLNEGGARCPPPPLVRRVWPGAAYARLPEADSRRCRCRRRCRSQEDHVESWHNRGVANQKLGKTEDALTSFEGALYYDPTFAPSLRGRFNALIELHRFDDAVAAANAAMSAAPGNPEPVVDRAFAHMQAGRCVVASGPRGGGGSCSGGERRQRCNELLLLLLLLVRLAWAPPPALLSWNPSYPLMSCAASTTTTATQLPVRPVGLRAGAEPG
jgi:tetratricopeptide (TPR) repeat protein